MVTPAHGSLQRDRWSTGAGLRNPLTYEHGSACRAVANVTVTTVWWRVLSIAHSMWCMCGVNALERPLSEVAIAQKSVYHV